MIRHMIRNKSDGKWLRRTTPSSTKYTWVENQFDATLFTTGSAASAVASRFCYPEKYSQKLANTIDYPVEVVKFYVTLIPVIPAAHENVGGQVGE